jgi:hypothetical protein
MGGAEGTMAISLVLSAIALVGFSQTARQRITVAEILIPISLAVVLLWPFWSFRFVLPLTPYLFFYLVTGLRTLTRSWQAARIALLCIIGLNLYDHVVYILHAHDQGDIAAVEWVGSSREVDAALDWIGRNVGPDGMMASTNPALLYLRTGRKSIGYEDSTVGLATWKARGVRYVASLLPLELPPGPPGSYKVLYRSSARLWVIEL